MLSNATILIIETDSKVGMTPDYMRKYIFY